MEKDQREALLDAGVRVVHARGLAATGVRDIAMAARVPQGSFTNHFRSKEAFGILVLDRYAERIDAIMRETSGDDTRAPAERLMAYFDRIAASAAEAEWRRGCMVPDLAGEIAFHDDALRARLCAVVCPAIGAVGEGRSPGSASRRTRGGGYRRLFAGRLARHAAQDEGRAERDRP